MILAFYRSLTRYLSRISNKARLYCYQEIPAWNIHLSLDGKDVSGLIEVKFNCNQKEVIGDFQVIDNGLFQPGMRFRTGKVIALSHTNNKITLLQFSNTEIIAKQGCFTVTPPALTAIFTFTGKFIP